VQLADKVVASTLSLLSDLRAGIAADTGLVRSMLRMLSALGLYDARFLQPFLAATATAYQVEGAERAAALGAPDYLRHVDARLAEEAARARELMTPATAAPVLAVVQEQLVARHATGLLARGLGDLLEGPALDDLARLYRLLGAPAAPLPHGRPLLAAAVPTSLWLSPAAAAA
jgi:Cullin family